MTAGRPVVSTRAVRSALLAHARRAQPAECCGLLLGGLNRVDFAVPMDNVSAASTRYRIDPAAHIALRRALRAFSPTLQIVGVYHSHPNGDATFSATDLAEALYPDWIYLIVGLGRRPARLRAFRLAPGGPRGLKIRWRAAAPGL